jgi:hypothetical protein
MKRVVFTGGSGKAGKHALQVLLDYGYQVLNLDTKPLDNPKARTLITDITIRQVFNASPTIPGCTSSTPDLRPSRSTPWCISRPSRAS